MSNKKYTAIKNDHCLTFDMQADIEEADEDRSIKN
jgi:hypothetical protein